MTNRVRQPPLEQHAPAELRPGGRAGGVGSLRTPSIIGGVCLLLMSALAGFGALVAVDGLVTPGDPATTAADILGSEGTFRLGVASLYLVVVLDVVVAWALFRVFSPVDVQIARLAAWFRLAYSGVFLVAISQLAGIPRLLGSDEYSAAFGAEQIPAQALQKVDAYNDIWLAGLVLFGVHLLLVGYLAYRSGYVPRILAALLVLAGLGYVLDTFATVLSSSPVSISSVTFLGEFLLACWLVMWGRRVSVDPAAGSR
jgi:uncharacterized protein DUF4386